MNLDNNALWRATAIGAAIVLVLALLSQIPFVGLLFCCVLWLSYIGIGALYGYLVRRGGGYLTAGSAALGGAIAAALAGIVQGIVSALATLVFTSEQVILDTLSQLEAQGFDVPPEWYELYTSSGFGIASALIGLCFAFFIAAVMGAIGGAIYGAVQRSQAPPPPPPSYPSEPPAEPFEPGQPEEPYDPYG